MTWGQQRLFLGEWINEWYLNMHFKDKPKLMSQKVRRSNRNGDGRWEEYSNSPSIFLPSTVKYSSFT